MSLHEQLFVCLLRLIFGRSEKRLKSREGIVEVFGAAAIVEGAELVFISSRYGGA